MDELLAQARAAAGRGEVDAAIALCEEAHHRWPEQLEPITVALQILDRTDTGDRLVFWAELGLARAPGEIFYQAAMAYGRDLRASATLPRLIGVGPPRCRASQTPSRSNWVAVSCTRAISAAPRPCSSRR